MCVSLSFSGILKVRPKEKSLFFSGVLAFLPNKHLVTRPNAPLSHCVSCGIADYRCYTPTSFLKNARSQSTKTGLTRGVSQKKLASKPIALKGASHEIVSPIALQWDTKSKHGLEGQGHDAIFTHLQREDVLGRGSRLSCTQLRVPPVALHVSQLISWIL